MNYQLPLNVTQKLNEINYVQLKEVIIIFHLRNTMLNQQLTLNPKLNKKLQITIE